MSEIYIGELSIWLRYKTNGVRRLLTVSYSYPRIDCVLVFHPSLFNYYTFLGTYDGFGLLRGKDSYKTELVVISSGILL